MTFAVGWALYMKSYSVLLHHVPVSTETVLNSESNAPAETGDCYTAWKRSYTPGALSVLAALKTACCRFFLFCFVFVCVCVFLLNNFYSLFLFVVVSFALCFVVGGVLFASFFSLFFFFFFFFSFCSLFVFLFVSLLFFFLFFLSFFFLFFFFFEGGGVVAGFGHVKRWFSVIVWCVVVLGASTRVRLCERVKGVICSISECRYWGAGGSLYVWCVCVRA